MSGIRKVSEGRSVRLTITEDFLISLLLRDRVVEPAPDGQRWHVLYASKDLLTPEINLELVTRPAR